MKTKSTSRAAPARRSPWLAVVFTRRRLGEGGFFNSRTLIGFALCSVGLLPALAGWSQSVTGTIATKAPAQTLGTWEATDRLATARFGHTATLLPNGQVLVAGGGNDSGVVATAELYDPATGLWTATGHMATTRISHTATLLPDGRVLVAGGRDNNEIRLATAELYNPATGLWTATGKMTAARTIHTATLLPNGQVLVAGGYVFGSIASAELYDPATGRWTATANLATARYFHTATLLPNGQVLVAGGYGNTGLAVASAELYDPATGLWTATDSMTTERSLHTATLLPNGKALVAGGFDGSYTALASAELYDPATGLWTATGRLVTGRVDHTATLLPNGQVLVAGGFSFLAYFASAELFDPATGLWTATGSMITERNNHTATLLPNGEVLVAGGFNDIDRTLASAELYTSGGGGELTLVSAASRLTHGTVGTFDINLPLSGGGIEGRCGPSRQVIVFTFSNNVTGADSVTTSCGTAAPASVDPNDAHSLLVKLTALSCDQQLVTVTLNGVHDDQGNTLTSASVTFGLLFGDVNGDGIVNKADVVSIRAVQGQHLNISNFRNDLTLDGRINDKDVGTYKTFRGDSL